MLTYPPFPKFIDSTGVDDYRTCPRKYLYNSLRGLAPEIPSVHLVAGGAFAKGLEVARGAFWKDHLPPEDALAKGALALIKEYGDPVPYEDHKKNLPKTLDALSAYFEHFGWEEDYITPFENSFEGTFALPLPIHHPQTNDPLIYTGRCDLIGQFQDNIWIVDEKTTGSVSASWSRSFGVRGQLIGYCYAAREMDLPVAGAIVRGIAFTKDFSFAEVICPYGNWQLEEWMDNLLITAQQMIDDWMMCKWRKVLGSACGFYGGCSFIEACQSKHPEGILESIFVERKWDPLSPSA